ncbi:MAG: PAS domain-containing protein, partial [Candidatus Dadabacteria bacterium]|nr:PAS domain-containing protein [Candidatus Dadabacteria bacterium]
ITGYKFCRDGLLENENKFLALLDITPDVVCELGTGGTIIYVSPNSADKLTYSPSDLRGREFFSFVHGNDVKRVMTKMTCSLKSASTEYTSCRFRTKKGDWQWIDCVIKPYKSAAGQPRLIFALKKYSSVLNPLPSTHGLSPGSAIWPWTSTEG